jgi:predicted nucleic acid-binding protein
MFYADTSALVKLVVIEPESGALLDWLGHRDAALATSDLARTELVRSMRRRAPEAITQARDVLSRLLLVRADAQIFDEAARLMPPEVRSLDAVHLTTALALGDDLEGVITYNLRMADAAHGLGLEVAAPGTPRNPQPNII